MTRRISSRTAASHAGERRVHGVLVGFFVISRIIFFLAGVRFDSHTIYYFAQLLDPILLQSRLLESLWYLHSQPPIFNALTGVVLKVSPGAHSWLLWLLFMVLGCGIMLLLYGTLRRLGIGPWWAAGAAAAFVSTPAFVLYENWYFYEQLVLAVLIGIGYAFLRSAGNPNRWLALAFWLCAVLVGLRSVYHPLYALLACGLAVLLAARGQRLAAARLAALPLLLVSGLLVKNWLLFGLAATSSWGGNSLHRVATAQIDRTTLEQLVAEGVVAPLALDWQFRSGERIAEMLQLPMSATGVPALDQVYKTPLNEHTRINPVNYNHWAYAAASGVYTRDAVRLIRRYPRAYLRTVAYNAKRFLDPVTHGDLVRPNRDRILPIAQIAERLARYAHVLVALSFSFTALAAVRPRVHRGERLLLLFAVGTVAWATLIGITLETGENNRFRYQLTGLHLILVACMLRSMNRYIARLRAPAGAAAKGARAEAEPQPASLVRGSRS